METITTLAFVRHGHVDNPRNIYYGRSPHFKLSEQGKFQAHSAADILREKPISAVFSSPTLRSRQTAQFIAAPHVGVTVHISRRLHEVYTPFDGCPISEIIARSWDVYTGSDSEYEQPCDVIRRILRFAAQVRRQYLGQYIVAVTHDDAILLMMLQVLGIPLDTDTVIEYKRTHPYIAPASISTFVYRTMEINEVPSYQYIES